MWFLKRFKINNDFTSWLIGNSGDISKGVRKFDELRIYNRALTEGEIQQIVGIE